MGGFIIGTMLGQLAGSWAYWKVYDRRADHNTEWRESVVAGTVSAVVAAAVYIPTHVQIWLAGEHGTWKVAVFVAVCMGLCQGILWPERPWQTLRKRRSDRAA